MDVREGSSGRLVDDAEDVESSNDPGVFCRLSLVVGEVGRHGNDRLGHGLLRYASAARLIFWRISAESSWGVYCLPSTSITAMSLSPRVTG